MTSWTRKSIVYQVYLRSFKDGNEDGVGDLKGLIEKLDYLNDSTSNSLGVNALLISSFYTSPMVDFGYDVANFTNVDPLFGDLKLFDQLIKESKKRGIKILLDFVLNHTSIDHLWFSDSRSSKANLKRDWYIWADPKPDGSAPNNWLSVFGGSAWEFEATTNQYYLHTFLKEQPDLNLRNIEVIKEMSSILKFWMDRGVSGFRLDAVNHLVEDVNLRNDPVNLKFKKGDYLFDQLVHHRSRDIKGIQKIINTFSDVIKSRKDVFMFSEGYLSVSKMHELYEATSVKLHAPLNMNFIELSWDVKAYKKSIDGYHKTMLKGALPNYVMGNHDRLGLRVAARFGYKNARLSAMLFLTLPGLPFIYYGDEIGMNSAISSKFESQDPIEKDHKGFQKSRDINRTPMQWDPKTNAGFSTKEPWLPVGSNYLKHNVEVESKDPFSMLALYKFLIHFRLNSEILLEGAYIPLPLQSEIFSFIREYKGKKILVILNFSSKIKRYNCKLSHANVICSTDMKRLNEEINTNLISLKGNEGLIILLTKSPRSQSR